MDRRAAKFFDDVEGVEEIIAANQTSVGVRTFEFVAADYRNDLGLVDLDTRLVPKKRQTISVDRLRELGRGIACTRSPFAYVFERVA